MSAIYYQNNKERLKQAARDNYVKDIQLAHNKVRKRSILDELVLLKGTFCPKCLLELPEYCLEFHHGTAEKLNSVAELVAKGNKSAVYEAKKCAVLCVNCHRLEMLDERPVHNYHPRAIKLLVDSLKQAPCVDCGHSFHPIVMDFDHRPGTEKLFRISRLGNYRQTPDNLLKLETEIAKCDLVCANHHRIRTAQKSNFLNK